MPAKIPYSLEKRRKKAILSSGAETWKSENQSEDIQSTQEQEEDEQIYLKNKKTKKKEQREGDQFKQIWVPNRGISGVKGKE